MEFYGVRNFEVYLTLFLMFVPILGLVFTKLILALTAKRFTKVASSIVRSLFLIFIESSRNFHALRRFATRVDF